MKYWLSFAGKGKNLGIIIAEGISVQDCVNQCNAREINPGGEVLGHPIFLDNLVLPKKVRNWFETVETFKLINPVNLPSFLNADRLTAEEADELDRTGKAEFVCKECNTALKLGQEHIHTLN